MKTLFASIVIASCCTIGTFDLSDRMSMKVEAGNSYGTAWPLTPDSFVTAWHVVEGCPPDLVTVNGLQVESFSRIPEQDAVILRMANPHGYTPWPLDVRELLPGERVFLSGWGAGLHWWSEGFVTNDQDRLSLNIAPGDSGGPVMDADGEVIGIVVAQGLYSQNHCWIIPLAQLGLRSRL